MADRGAPERELVYCYECQNEWHRDQGGLMCPECHSEFTQVIEPDSDPRNLQADDYPLPSPPQHPLHHHNPWAHEAPDPDDGDIERVEWNSGPNGVRYTRMYYRSSANGIGARRQHNDDPLGPFFHNFATMVGGIVGQPSAAPNTHPDGNQRNEDFGPGIMFGSAGRPGTGSPAPANSQQEGHGREGFGGRNAYTATGRLWPRDANNAQPQMTPVGDLHGLLSHIFEALAPIDPGNAGGARGDGPHPPGSPFAMLARMLNPANAAYGDAVYTQEALDRVISQLMEQHSGGSAPGPASAAAIQALPKRKVDKSMMGDNGKAECSVCMDNVELGDEVTFLPCNHWFHGDCVGAWLREHDTCPHCRQGIMPKEGEGHTVRSPDQEPRHSQMPMSPGREGSRRNPFLVSENSSSGYFPRDDVGSRRESRPGGGRRSSNRDMRGTNDGNSGGGGITGWVRNHFGGSGT